MPVPVDYLRGKCAEMAWFCAWQASFHFLLGMGSRWSDSWLALVFKFSELSQFCQAAYKLPPTGVTQCRAAANTKTPRHWIQALTCTCWLPQCLLNIDSMTRRNRSGLGIEYAHQ